MKKINLGLMGCGNIGTGTYKALEMNRAALEKNTGVSLEIIKILEKDTLRDRGIVIPPEKFTQNPDDILENPDIHIVLELLGGVEPASGFMIKAMKNGKHVVTANKAAVAARYEDLTGTARDSGVFFRFEASVGGGIPILTPLSTILGANEFEEILGIVNGTTNYILTQMTENGLDYADVLKSAQEKGFAEADPTADVEGLDVANKLSILMALAFGLRVLPEDIPTRGISSITLADIEEARKKNCRIKLLASARKTGDKVEYSVKPTLLPANHPLSSVSNEFNAVFVKGNAVGELMFYGKGAGPLPTASAVLGDVIDIVGRLK